jgi:translocation and assembly module TamB
MKKRLVRIFLAVCATAVLAVALLPAWFPWVLRPVAQRYGVRFGAYERVGLSRFALRQVVVRQGGTEISAARVEAWLPSAWLWHRYRTASPLPGGRPYVEARDWEVRDRGATRPAASDAPVAAGSTFELLDEIEGHLSTVRQWLPSARFSGGRAQAGAEWIEVARIEWTAGDLLVEWVSPWGNQAVITRGDFTSAAPHAIEMEAAALAMRIGGRLERQASRWVAHGEVGWHENRGRWEMEFGPGEWWPARAALTAEQARVPAKLVGLRGYEQLSGSVALEWKAGVFDVRVEARAEPVMSERDRLPPLSAELAARGDWDSAWVERLELTTPWARAELTAPVRVQRTGQLLSETARLRVAVQLEQLPVAGLAGMLSGELRAEPGAEFLPRLEFAVAGHDLAAFGENLQEFVCGGWLQWPVLVVEHSSAVFADESALEVSARLDFAANRVTEGSWRFRGDRLRRYLPAKWGYKSFAAAGEVGGSFEAIEHAGGFEAAEFVAPGLAKMDVAGSWSGTLWEIARFDVSLTAGGSRLEAAGRADVSGWLERPVVARLERLALARDEKPLYQLQTPVEVAAQRVGGDEADAARPARWRVSVGEFRWMGVAGVAELAGEVTWPVSGRLVCRLRGFEPDAFREFVARPLPEVTVTELDFTAAWEDGPLVFELTMHAGLEVGEGGPLVVRAAVAGTERGIEIRPLNVSGPLGPVLAVEGIVPLQLAPARWPAVVELDRERSLDLRAWTKPNRRFWEWVAEISGVRFEDPDVRVELRGRVEEPEGLVRMRAALVELNVKGLAWPLPRMEQLRVEADLKRDVAELRLFTLEVEGQPVTVTGRLPLGAEVWTALLTRGTLPDWQTAQARVEIVDAAVGPFARFLPAALHPQGRINADLTVGPGQRLEGEVRLAEAATRPLPPMGPIRDIEARVVLGERTAVIRTFKGTIGGQPVRLTGEVRLPQDGPAEFALELRGRNVPLVREPGLILRADLALKLTQAREQPALLSGEVTLRDSVYLQEVDLFAPGQPQRAPARAPYFSVEEEPFADWRLEVKLRGERALRVRSPLFRGTISAALELAGTLREPVATGEARVADGVVRFPFADLVVHQGWATLTSERPHTPELFLSAGAQSFGYHISMTVGGTADQPLITFSSTPPLSSEEIVLMLTAGELPRSEFAFTTQQKASRLALFFGRDMLLRLGVGEETAERLVIRSGEEVAEQGGLTYYIEYRLSDRWSVVAEYDRFNALNAGLKWKIYSR